jgi:tripartite-type tricarboxylate transporter receptor subunit TctC
VLRGDLTYDPIADFVGVAPLTAQPYVLVVSASAGLDTLEDVVIASRAGRGQLRFASTGVGTGTHLAVELLNAQLELSAAHAPAGPADSITETVERVVRGHADYALAPISMVTAQLAAGDLVALGVSTVRRSQLLPTIPTLAEAGAINFDFPIWYGLWAPAGTPAETVDWLRAGVADVLSTDEAQARLGELGAEPMTTSGVEFDEFVQDEVSRARRIVIAAGIAADREA